MSATIEEGFIEEEILDEVPSKILTYMNTDTFELVSSDVEPEGAFVEMDENIAYVISTLNKLGYKTAYSCEGHYTHDPNSDELKKLEETHNVHFVDFEEGYVAFAEGISLPFIPENWIDFNVDGCVIIYAAKPKGDVSEIQFLFWKFEALINLLEWVRDLPPYDCIEL